jgi:amino acid efflux transporter
VRDSVPLHATLKLPQIVAFYTGAVLGSGILIVPGLAAELAGPASLLAWGVMTVMVIPMALLMGLLSAKYPNAGGVSYFVTKAFNSHIGSLVGWFFLLSVVVGAPVLALTGAGYLCAAAGLGDTSRLAIAVGILLTGIAANYVGIRITGQFQIAVVLTTLAILIAAIAGSVTRMGTTNFSPLMPHGWRSIGHTTTLLFWCFIGWEAVSHVSDEFKNPERDAIKGTAIAGLIISIFYFMTAFVVVGTHSYGPAVSDVSLIRIIKISFGSYGGALVAGYAALFICMAPAMAYISAASRLVYSLGATGYAPKGFARLSKKYHTPLGGLWFLSACFAVLLLIFNSRLISLSALIQMPNATFILTYIGGSAAGIVLLRGSRFGVFISVLSLMFTIAIFLFVRSAILYPVAIALFWWGFIMVSKKTKAVGEAGPAQETPPSR